MISSSQGLQMYNPQLADHEDIVSSSIEGGSPSSSLLYNLSVLKDKVHQVQSLVSILISPDQPHTAAEPNTTTSLAIASMGSLVQEIIVTASSMIFICQQMSLGTTSSSSAGNNHSSTMHHQLHQQQQQHQVPNFSTHENCVENMVHERGGQQGFYSSTGNISNWYGTDLQVVSNDDNKLGIRKELPRRSEVIEGSRPISPRNCDIIELDAADLLAKYTHYCQVCGKGFKRDANLRMHMRAHGDEYKTSAALTNPMKNRDEGSGGGGGAGPNCSTKFPKKYSCPQEGCRWNQKHAKFQPLKSMICVKNHYKRSHCPKMYVCKRCNRKQFSVLSDLRTHEKHCGDLKWQCSCGTTFSRKDKLMGHVALFVGHTPLVTTTTTTTPLSKPGQPQHQDTTMQLDDRG